MKNSEIGPAGSELGHFLAHNFTVDTESPSLTDPPPLLQNCFFVYEKNSFVRLPINSILYLKAESNYVRIFTQEQRYLVSQSLSRIEQKMQTYPYLMRVHRSYLINTTHISRINTRSVCIADHTIPITKKVHKTFMGRIQAIQI